MVTRLLRSGEANDIRKDTLRKCSRVNLTIYSKVFLVPP